MKIGAYISELLLQGHDSVILPGFGEFYTKYSPAKFLPEEKKVESPSKTIAFNPDLKTGETPLIAYIAKFEYFDNAQAQNYLGTFVDELNNQLKQGKKVELEKLGVFNELPDGNVHFEPDRTINYLTQAAGYGSIPVPETVAATAATADIPQTAPHAVLHANEVKTMENNKRTKLPSAVRWLAFTLVPIIIILLILALNFNYFFGERRISSSDKDVAGVVTTEKADMSSTSAADMAAADVAAADPATGGQTTQQPSLTGADAAGVSAQQQTSQTATSQTQQPPQAESGRPVFYIVVGSFPDQAQAEALALKLRNQGANLASVFMRTGFNYHRVCYGYYYDIADAEALLPGVQETINKEAYILHR